MLLIRPALALRQDIQQKIYNLQNPQPSLIELLFSSGQITPSKDKNPSILNNFDYLDPNSELSYLKEKIATGNLYQIQVYCLGNSELIGDGLASLFNTLIGKNHFTLAPFHGINNGKIRELLKLRWLPTRGFVTSFYPTFLRQMTLGSFIISQTTHTD